MVDTKKNKKVMVFGVFDLIHPGHVSFLEQAALQGMGLIAVVTRDSVVYELKKKAPVYNEAKRMHMVRQFPYVHKAILGDAALGSYNVVRKYKPDVICLGYDQRVLHKDLQFRMDSKEIALIEIVVMAPYKAERFHTSLLTPPHPLMLPMSM